MQRCLYHRRMKDFIAVAWCRLWLCGYVAFNLELHQCACMGQQLDRKVTCENPLNSSDIRKKVPKLKCQMTTTGCLRQRCDAEQVCYAVTLNNSHEKLFNSVLSLLAPKIIMNNGGFNSLTELLNWSSIGHILLVMIWIKLKLKLK